MKTCSTCSAEMEDAAVRCGRCGGRSTADAVNDAVTGARVRPSTVTRASLLCNRYEIADEIGRGGMGVVYRARDRERRNVEVALKVLPPELASDARAVDDLTKEADLAMSLAHPNIISLHNLERDAATGTRFLVMEFIRGESLAGLLERRGPLPADEAVALVTDALAGLEYAHARGVVHRDVKPSNLMRTLDGVVKLGDFGIARRAKDALQVITGRGATGTLLYMSPEQLRGESVDSRTDIYSMGCVLYELLSGRPPFHSGAVEWQIQNQTPARIPSAPDHVWNAIVRATAKDRAARFARCSEFGAALRRAPAVAEPARAQPAEPPKPVAPSGPPAPPPTPGAPEPRPPRTPAEAAHYGLIYLARLALIGVMLYFGSAKSHREVVTQDSYAIAWWAGGGAAVLLFLIAAVLAWTEKKRTGKAIGGTWTPAARIFVVLPLLIWWASAYATRSAVPGDLQDRTLSACLFSSLALLLFSSFFAVRIAKMALCVLLIGGVLVGREFQGEIGKKLRLEAVRPEPPPKSDPVPKNDSVPVRTTVTTLVPPPPKLGKYEPPVIPDFGVVYTVASWGGGFQGRDVLDLGIGSRSGALGRISSVTWKFPADWSPATHVATTPANGFAVRIQPLAPFRVTATITQTDGAVFSVVQDIRWR